MPHDLAGASPAWSAAASDGSVLLLHEQIIDALQSLCGAKRSGTMFIITAENHVAQFILRGGEVVGLSHRLLRGLDALPSMRTFTAGRYRFVEESVDRSDPGLPATLDLLALLIPEHAGPPESPQPTPPTPNGRQALESVRALIEPELTEFLGPMAELICQEHLAHLTALTSPQHFTRLVEAIAKEIGDSTKEAQFKQRVLSSFRGVTADSGEPGAAAAPVSS
jgi:hypothetical protein